VISQSFGAAEESFNGGTAALQNLRGAFKSAKANHVSVFASSGDGGNANVMKSPVGGPNSQPVIPFPTVIWPGSDPLVTSVGGTYLCANALTGSRTADSANPPSNCQNHPGVTEVGWVVAGGGFSHVFGKPSDQNTLPPSSNTGANTNNMRGIPDVGMEASARTGVLVYDGGSWFVVGGTSVSSPTFAAVVAIADQVNGAPLGFLNDALYKIGNNPSRYANDFFDVTTGNNDQFKTPQDPNYAATVGWDPVTGLGAPNAVNLVPDLIAAVNGAWISRSRAELALGPAPFLLSVEHERVATPRFVHDVDRNRQVSEDLAESPDVVADLFGEQRRVSPGLAEDLRGREKAVGMAEQELEELELTLRE
jgi:subtilase family serine protease